MKFEFDGDADRGECVAVLHYLNGGTDECLAIKASCDDVIWFYPHGLVSVQRGGMSEDDSQSVIKKFYKGDKITITF